MRHKIKTNRLDRFSSLRKATINSLSRALLLNQSIKTTKALAEAAVPQIEHLIHLGKTNTLAGRRQAFKALQDHQLVSRLFGEIAGLFKERNSGYTRMFKLGPRRGDNAQMVLLEFTDKAAQKPKKDKPKDKGHIPKEEKPHTHAEERNKAIEKKEPTKKFLGGIKGIFKKERDSL